MTQTRDEMFMREALRLAREAEAAGEVPVGAGVVIGEEIAGRGFNRPIGLHDPTAHAEMLAIREAARTVNNYRLSEAEVFVTLELCVMCAGALVAARVERLVFGTRDLRFGGVRSKFRIADSGTLNHTVEVVEGVLRWSAWNCCGGSSESDGRTDHRRSWSVMFRENHENIDRRQKPIVCPTSELTLRPHIGLARPWLARPCRRA